MLTPEDADLVLASIPEVDMVSPSYGNRMPVEYNGKSTTSGYTEGVNPSFEIMRRMFPVAGGRFLNIQDVEQKRRVVFLGHEITSTLFNGEDPIGKQISIGGFPFTVVGVMPKKFQNSMSNGPDDQRVIIPYSTFNSIWPQRDVWYLAVKPKNPADNLLVQQRLRDVLGRKYRFHADDDRAIRVWDSIEDEATMRKIFRGIQIFMAVVGGMTLVIAGVGVANIMYVVVRERTREIGIKRAVGARRRHVVSQFILESILVTGIGGIVGAAGALAIISVVNLLPLEQNRSTEFIGTPTFSAEIAIFTVIVLVTIGLLAGLFPARRAAQIDPVEALRYE